jgi:hypothetical protein
MDLPDRQVPFILAVMESEWTANDGLAAITGGRAWLARRLVAPCWYHPCLGVLAGGLIAVGEGRNGTLFAWAVVNQHRVGVSIRYFDKAMTSVFIAQVLCMALVAVAACWLEFTRGLHGAFLVAGLCEFMITVAFGHWSDRVLRQRIEALQS